MKTWYAWSLTAFVAVVCAWGQPAKHPFSAHDWAALRSASPVAVSPDGTILCRITFGAEKGESSHEWRLLRSNGTDPRKVDLPEHFTPYGFMPDGASLYGSYQVNGKPQLAIFGLAGIGQSTTPSQLILLPAGIHSAALSPDGTRFAILADPNPPDELATVRTVVEPDSTGLYVVKTDGTGGKWWCPALKTLGEIAWSPDSATVAAVSVTPKIGFHTIQSSLDICTANGSRHVADVPNVTAGVAWGDGGKELVFLSTTTQVLTPDHVWTVATDGGAPVDRTPTLDGSALGLWGDPKGKIWVLVDHGVQNEIDAFANHELTRAFRWAEGVVSGPLVFPELAGAPGLLATTVGDPQHADNVAVVSGRELRKITTEGDEQLAKAELGVVRPVHWTSEEGIHLEGIATFPAGYVEGRRYPFLVYPHGGPESNDVLRMDSLPRMIAGLGYVVLQPEYRGSTGYGSDFLNSIFQHFGDRAYRDVDSATDFAVAQGWADPGKLAIFGWSAGGFMTSWTVTQTHRYRAAIEGAGITDWAPFLWTSDVQQFDYDSRWPEKDPEAFAQFSAVAHASTVTTPLLILHGAADLRVPTFQGREYFEVLKANGKTTRMVTYPGSPHFPRLWEQRLDIMREITAWLAHYNP